MAARTIRLYLLLQLLFTGASSFAGATYVMFLIHHGLNLFQVNLVNVVFMMTLFLMEIPTGAIADTWGRKASFVLACLVMSLGMYLYYVAETFMGFTLAETVAAIGLTCYSGAFQAWLIDTLHHHGMPVVPPRVFVRAAQTRQLANITGAVAGAYCADKNLALPWLLAAIAFLGTALLAMLVMKEPYFERSTRSMRADVQESVALMKRSVLFVSGHPGLKSLLMLGGIQCLCTQALNMQWQPLFSGHLTSNYSLGWLKVGMVAGMMLGASVCGSYLRVARNCSITALHLAQGSVALAIICSARSQGLTALAAWFMLHEVGRGAFDPIKEQYLQANIASRERATLGSCEQMSRHLGSAAGLVLSGVVAQAWSIQSAWLWSGIAMLGSTALLWKRNHAR
jgi:MFS family permease